MRSDTSDLADLYPTAFDFELFGFEMAGAHRLVILRELHRHSGSDNDLAESFGLSVDATSSEPSQASCRDLVAARSLDLAPAYDRIHGHRSDGRDL